MTGEGWRDDPSIVWQDEDGGRCLRVAKSPTGWSVTIGNPGHTLHAWAPGAYRSEVAERFLAALGLTADNLRLAPEPIKVGDRVRHIPSGDMEATVTDLGTERAIFVQLDDGQDDVWLTKHTERVAPAPSDTEQPEPVECSDPEALAVAVAAGLTVNPRPPGADWRDRQTYDRTVSAFREALDYGFRYRIHGTVPGYGETGGAS